MKNLSHVNDFDLHEIEPVAETHFHMNAFTRRLVLIQAKKTTRKWLINEVGKSHEKSTYF